MRIVNLILCGLGLACALAVAFSGSAVAQKAVGKQASVSVVITHVPGAGPGEESFGVIAGTVKNAPKECKLVIYSLGGGTWWVQPYALTPITSFDKQGHFRVTIHGGNEFAVLVVKSGYKPSLTIYHLPSVGGKILAIARAKRKP